MIIDCYASLGHWPFRRLADNDADSFVRLLDAYGITQAWVAPFEGLYYRHLPTANREILAQAARQPDRLIPWAVINPATPGWEDDLRQALEGGCQGLRLHPNYHRYDLTHPALRDLLAAAGQAGLPVALVHKVQDERLQHPLCQTPAVEMDVAPLVAACPRAALLCLGVGQPFITQHRDLIAAGQVYVDISRLEGVESVRWAVDLVGAGQVLLGSHAPYFYLEAALLKIQEAGLTPEERVRVLGGNAQELFHRK